MLTKDIAICIRTVDFSETSQIVTFFTRSTGKVSAIAKGSKRPRSAFGGPVEIFSCGNIVYSDAGRDKLATLTEFDLIADMNYLTSVRSNLFAMNCCFFAAELMNKLTLDYDPHPELFDAFMKFLHKTESEQIGQSLLSLLILFQLDLLEQIGVLPVLNSCTNCKLQYQQKSAGAEIYFSSSANGLICRDCHAAFPDKIRLSPQAADCLADCEMLKQAGLKILKEIEKVLIYHFTEMLGYQTKMAKYFLTIIRQNEI